MKKSLLLILFCCATSLMLDAQTAHSLFWKRDSLQVNEIVSEAGNQFNQVGQHGPAVENSHMALRIYFNDSGAICGGWFRWRFRAVSAGYGDDINITCMRFNFTLLERIVDWRRYQCDSGDQGQWHRSEAHDRCR